MKTDIEIAREAKMLPITEIGAKLGLLPEDLLPYGHDKAKVTHAKLADLADRPTGNLILVTAISPTPPGEGKTTTTVGLADALSRIGKQVSVCIREASLGPNFGMKGGAAGGGMAQIVPMEDMNLHFTGDFHAVTSAHNLLAAMIDNHLHWGNVLRIDPRRVSWRRVMDVNDRALRDAIIGLGGTKNGHSRETGFDITAASEVMAILCLASDLDDLEARLGRIVIGESFNRDPVTAAQLGAAGAMTVLLKDALQPNLVQTLENTPAFVHGGPFANIAHGCNTLVATRAAMQLSDYVVTEAGFGADLGAEKFFDIVCRVGELEPAAVVLVATVRALKYNGGVAVDDLSVENVPALVAGCANLGRHIENLRRFGVPVVVAINHFTADTEDEIHALQSYCARHGAKAVVSKHWAEGGAGAEELGRAVVDLVEAGDAEFEVLYPTDAPLTEKIETVAKKIYHAESVYFPTAVRNQLAAWEESGFGHFPVCLAKTQYSFSADPKALGAPEGFEIPIREVRLSAGAGFVVALVGEIMTMPGLPRHPAAERIRLDDGDVVGLF
ncbi:formate--tetrahydrofolate ligase [Gulosibacter macacae]|uniref:Formate--tetrahydrofolate ligase n=1 Tax=Gulosibacter macacae TaxID=2488791 RepID=A0A3P3VTE1_9MICO|nr:formate--tetrahydrofolate ligase [Gulosibacter macacae]RRJ85587.1 formate--tetrahydrofolate ligase [Gulosibacter macacae]